MNLTLLSVRNPVGTILLMLVVFALGFLALIRLPIGFFPVFSIPACVIVTAYPGASAVEVEQEVTKIIERAITSVSNIERIQSNSTEGFSQVQVSLDWGADLDEAVYKLQSALEIVQNELPREVEKPTVITINSLIQVSMELGVTSSTRDLTELREYAEDYLQERFNRLNEVAIVRISGGTERIVEVLVDKDKLAARSLSLMQIIGALQQNNINIPGGRITEKDRDYIVRAIGRYQNLDDIKNTLIIQKENAPVYLYDIASVSFTKAEERVFTRINCIPSIGIGIGTRSDGNVVAMCDAVKEELKILEKTLPEDIKIFIARDQSTVIKRSVNSVIKDALIGGLLASVVVFLFLGSIRNTIVIAVSIPFSIVATFALMRAFGLSLNIVSLGGIALGTGLIVDSAIIVLESIYRHLKDNTKGDREENIVFGTREVGLAITASTLTTLAVFIPLAFLRGLAAVFLGELALTVVFALIASLIVAITVVPMLGFKLIRVKEQRGFDKIWPRISNLYKGILRWSLNHRLLTLVFTALFFIFCLFLVRFLEVELLPASDEGQFQVTLEYPVGTPVEVTGVTTCQIEDHLKKYSEVVTTFATIGRVGVFDEEVPNKSEMIVQLVPASQRKDIEKVMAKIRRELPAFPGAKIEIGQQGLEAGISGADIDVRIQGDDLAVLRELGENAVAAVQDIPGVVNLNSSLSTGKPEIQVYIDRVRAADLGVTSGDVAATLRTAISGSVATKWTRTGKEYEIQVRLPRNSRKSFSDVSNLLIPSREGNIPLYQVARVSYGDGPVSINRDEQIRNVAITADISGRSRREVIGDITKNMNALNMPDGYEVVYEGQSRAIRDSFISLTEALIIAVFLVYVVMGIQFGSFIYPLIIMFSLPLASMGVFLGLFVAGSSISLNSFLGFLVLAGIVVNDAIVLIDYIITLRKRGMDRDEAILEAGPIRLRPILMTSFTTIFGALPIALAIGEGAEALAPLGIAIIGGLTTSTFLTLVVIPCIYAIFDDISRRKFKPEKEAI